MDENIIVSEEITGTTDQIIESTGSGNGWKTVGGLLLVAGVSYVIYRGAKWVNTKMKQKKEVIQYIDDEKAKDVNED